MKLDRVLVGVGVGVLGLCAAASAGPRGGVVSDPTAATITQVGKLTTINQTADRAFINWTKFESTASETIRFNQPNTTSFTVNKIVGLDPSLISGALEANGRLFIINPNGIIFGAGARVNVGSLVATTLNINEADFDNNRFKFLQDPGIELSSVINRGSITTNAPGGLIALIAPIVDNSGTIVAAAGRVFIRANTRAGLNTSEPDIPGPPRFPGEPPPPEAAGLNVRMATVGLTPLLENVVNTSSVNVANKVQRLNDGTVFLRGSGGTIVNGGTIRADGDANNNGGVVHLEAQNQIIFGQGSLVSAVSPRVNSGTGRVELVAYNGSMSYTQGGSAAHARAVVQGNEVQLLPQKGIRSDEQASLHIKGKTIEYLGAGGLGEQGKPVRMTTDDLNLLSGFGENSILFDGNSTINFYNAGATSTLDAVNGVILAGVGKPSGAVPGGVIFFTDGGNINVQGFKLNIDHVDPNGPSLKVFDFLRTDYSGKNITRLNVTSSTFPEIAGGNGLANDSSTPVARGTYTPPSDPLDVEPGGASTPTIGARDNALIPTLRNTLVKSDSESSTSADAGGLIEVTSRSRTSEGDGSDPEAGFDGMASRPDKDANRVARATRGRDRTGGARNP